MGALIELVEVIIEILPIMNKSYKDVVRRPHEPLREKLYCGDDICEDCGKQYDEAFTFRDREFKMHVNIVYCV